jgi:DNA integrity scanning protein DisA with diadenylate cyclase activity
MRLAWSDPELERCCVSGTRLRVVAGAQVEAAQDLLHAVARAAQLADLMTFRSVRVGVSAGSLILSIEEIDMYARPLTPDGKSHTVAARSSLQDHHRRRALLVEDLHVQGRSVLRLAS